MEDKKLSADTTLTVEGLRNTIEKEMNREPVICPHPDIAIKKNEVFHYCAICGQVTKQLKEFSK
jgi:ribonucleotide monophosphatase NagD (HAD superfamily)